MALHHGVGVKGFFVFRDQQGDPGMPPPEFQPFVFEARDGAQISAYRLNPNNEPKGVVQIAHGMAEHARRYKPLAQALTGAGYAVYAHDHRGHGGSAEVHGLGNFGPGGFQSLVDDMATLTGLAKAETPSVPFVLLGHSMGSFASQLYLSQHHAELDALALSGTAALDLLLNAMLTSGQPVGANLLNAPFAPARTTHDWLSCDEAQVDAYLSDPLCGFELHETATASMFSLGVGARQDARLKDVRPDLPVYVISGEFDPVTGPGQAFTTAVLDSYRAAGLERIDHRVYPGGRHEMFNETCRREVEADFIAWLDAHFNP